MKHYVLGFSFNFSLTHALLIRKNRPEWQKGRLNGLGGEVKIHETPIEAMLREYAEKARLVTAQSDWIYFAVLSGPGYQVHCFAAQAPLGNAVQNTDESLVLVSLPLVPNERPVDHVDWLLPLASENIRIRDRGLKPSFTILTSSH